MSDSATDTRWNDLITAVADHADKQAFAELFKQFAPQLKAYALSKSGAAG